MSETLEAVRSAPRTVRYDKGRHLRAKIGFVLLAMEQTVEDDVFKIAPPGVGIHFNRLIGKGWFIKFVPDEARLAQ